MVSGACFLRLMFTPHERSCLRVKWLDNHTPDHGRSQVHIRRHVHEISSLTLQLQLQQQSFNTYQLTPMKRPHLLSHEMTGQLDSSALDQFLSSPHVVSYPAVLLLLLGRALFSREGWVAIVFALPATLSTASSLDSSPRNGRRITLQPKLVSRHTSHNVHEEFGTTFNTGLSETSHVQFASGEYIAFLAGKLLHVVDVSVAFHVQFEVLLAKKRD